jgi:hypothetical protein
MWSDSDVQCSASHTGTPIAHDLNACYIYAYAHHAPHAHHTKSSGENLLVYVLTSHLPGLCLGDCLAPGSPPLGHYHLSKQWHSAGLLVTSSLFMVVFLTLVLHKILPHENNLKYGYIICH